MNKGARAYLLRNTVILVALLVLLSCDDKEKHYQAPSEAAEEKRQVAIENATLSIFDHKLEVCIVIFRDGRSGIKKGNTEEFIFSQIDKKKNDRLWSKLESLKALPRISYGIPNANADTNEYLLEVSFAESRRCLVLTCKGEVKADPRLLDVIKEISGLFNW